MSGSFLERFRDIYKIIGPQKCGWNVLEHDRKLSKTTGNKT